jgi:hypothetical protein
LKILRSSHRQCVPAPSLWLLPASTYEPPDRRLLSRIFVFGLKAHGDEDDEPPTRRLRPRVPASGASAHDDEDDEPWRSSLHPRVSAFGATAHDDEDDGVYGRKDDGPQCATCLRGGQQPALPSPSSFDTDAKSGEIVQQTFELLPGLYVYKEAFRVFGSQVRAQIASQFVTLTPTPMPTGNPSTWPVLGNAVDPWWSDCAINEPENPQNLCPSDLDMSPGCLENQLGLSMPSSCSPIIIHPLLQRMFSSVRLLIHQTSQSSLFSRNPALLVLPSVRLTFSTSTSSPADSLRSVIYLRFKPPSTQDAHEPDL